MKKYVKRNKNVKNKLLTITRQEMANILGISKRTLYRRFKSVNFKCEHKYLTKEDQIKIIKLLGYDENE